MPQPTIVIPRRIRKQKEINALALNDGKLMSTFQASYRLQDIQSIKLADYRQDYARNKSNSAKGGEWSIQEPKSPTAQSAPNVKSCYRDSYKFHDLKDVRETMSASTHYRKCHNGTQGENEFQLNEWFQYRMKKPQKDDPGKHYDILTGIELNRAPSGIYDPHRKANRVSFEKMNERNQGRNRNYNIISNQVEPARYCPTTGVE